MSIFIHLYSVAWRYTLNYAELASIDVKVRNNEEISEIEKHRILLQYLRELNMWELSYVRYNRGLYSPEQWHNWNGYYELGFIAVLPEEWWADVKPWYQDDFAKHVDAAYAKKCFRLHLAVTGAEFTLFRASFHSVLVHSLA